MTEKGPGMSFYAVAALALFVAIVVLLTIIICLIRIHVWRIHRWKRRHIVLPSDDEQEDDFDKDDPDGLFKTHKKRDAPADHEYIRRTMKTASGFVQQCLNQSSFKKKAATRPSLLHDDFDLAASSCDGSSSHDDTMATATTVHDDDAECPTTICVSIQPATSDLVELPQLVVNEQEEAQPNNDAEASSTNCDLAHLCG